MKLISIKRLSLCLVILALCSCGVTKKPLQPVLEKRVQNIEIAKIETGNVLMIQQVNPVILAMGSTGQLLDTAIVAQRAHEYKQAAGPVNQMCTEMFEKSLLKALARKGIAANSSGKRYWDYYKGKQKEQNGNIGAILRIELKNVGFWSRSMVDAYRPSILVMAELIEPGSRKVLYSDSFTLGIDMTSTKVMMALYGEINMLPAPRNSKSYKSFAKLVKNPEQSRNALLKTVSAAARHMAKGLNGEGRFIAKTYAKTAAQVQIATSNDLIVNVYNARTRKAPSIRSQILYKVNKGHVMTQMQKKGEWLYVRLENGKKAWAHQSIFLKQDETIIN
ncbi:SH3 domain-containing protein [Mariprofundus sp. NF]|uniref:SH3 domain-containing protein n=1 Tax=Mariprofundus sp. NF TaxID=2608716 RepID=UPI00159FC887|nr:SH3 domain-containing protein [Mariprofundus sp. NF]